MTTLTDFLIDIPWWFWATLVAIVFAVVLRINGFFSRNVFFSSAKFKRAIQITAGFGFWNSLSWVFDNIAYPGVIAWFISLHGEGKGLVEGGLVMTALAVLIELSFLLVYVRQKTDWMGMDVLQSVRENGDAWIVKFRGDRYRNPVVKLVMRVIVFVPITVFRAVLWMLQKGDVFAFFALSIFMAPFPTTIYLRRDRLFDSLGKRDWMIFTASAVVGNFYWTLRSYGVVVIIRYLWNAVA